MKQIRKKTETQKRKANIKNILAKSAAPIVIFLMITSTFAALPSVVAHDPPLSIPTYAYIQAVPNPVGVDQSAHVYMWIDKIPDGAMPGNNIRLHDYKLTITAPDGSVETKTWETIEDTTSNQGYSFTPSQTGTYTLKFDFPGLLFTYTDPVFGPSPSEYLNDTYLPSTASTTLVVQEEPIYTYPTNPLPTEYWARPIYGENPNWWSISSNWLGMGAPGYENGMLGVAFPGDAVGPLTNHVMWTKRFQSGGVVGGNNYKTQGKTFFEGSAYANRFDNPIIVDGRLFYNEPLSFGSASGGRTVCVDLRTGQEIWSRTDMQHLSFAYMYNVETFNQHGVYPPILYSSSAGFWYVGPVTLTAYDAYTGNGLFNVTDVPDGQTAMGPEGEYLVIGLTNYGDISAPNYYLTQWNMSKLWESEYFGASTTPSVVPPITDGTDPSLYDYNVSMPTLNTMAPPVIVKAFAGDVALCMSNVVYDGVTYYGTAGPTTSYTQPKNSPYTYFAVNLNASKGTIGSVLWQKTLNPLPGNLSVGFMAADPETDVFVEYITETMQYIGYSMESGQKIWGPVGNQDALAYYWSGYFGEGPTVAYGKLYSCSNMAGIVICFDLKTGKQLWSYGNGEEGNSTHSGFEVPGPYPTTIYAIGNDVVYTITGEHTVETPIYKGALARAINATTGEEIWTLSNVNTQGAFAAAIADGFATIANGYDNQIYCVGRGPSTTTVSAPDIAVDFGTPVVIKGTVMDIAAGTTQDEQEARFPNGVPAVSDESMSDWMGYVYQQKPRPSDVVGVNVTLSVLDSNNNVYDIGTVTTDANGFFHYPWTPEIPGDFTVYATFAGTNGYWPSQAENGFTVMQAPAATPAATPTAAPMTDTYVLGLGAGAIIAIVAVGLVLILMLRKR